MPTRAIFSALLLMCGLAAQASASHVQPELLANVSSIESGKPFYLGVRLTIDPTWHVYWKNPGDAGLASRVKLTVPDGFTAGELQFPTPMRFQLPGDIIAFGYENSVLLLTKVTPPANLPSDFQGQFHAAVSWLVCSNVCIPGKAGVDLTLGVSAAPSPANQELFDEWTRQLPTDLASNSDISSINVTEKGAVTIIWRHNAPDHVDFFPEVVDDYNIRDTDESSTLNTTVIHFSAEPLAGKSPAAMTFGVVLGYFDKAGIRRGVIISIDLPAWAGNNH